MKNWQDLNNPSESDLKKAAETFKIPPHLIEDCLSPKHLPKQESIESGTFLLLRVFDETTDNRAATTQKLTRKLIFFFGDQFLLTLHRAPFPFLRPSDQTAPLSELLHSLILASLRTFDSALMDAENRVELLEKRLFLTRRPAKTNVSEFHEIHLLKQRVGVIKRLLSHSLSALQNLKATPPLTLAILQDLRENALARFTQADELQDEINALLSMHLQVASHRTNEIMRVLTVFSVFFMPLTFLVGIYGMNFKYMPELDSPWGYPGALAAMATITGVIFLWFKKRGFFR